MIKLEYENNEEMMQIKISENNDIDNEKNFDDELDLAREMEEEFISEDNELRIKSLCTNLH